MNIAFIGNFVPKKGSQLFTQVVQKNQSDNFFIFGYPIDQENYQLIKKKIIKVRPFQEGELTQLLQQNKIDIVLTPSICPETFSLTYFNSLQAGVLVLTRPFGFPYFLLQSHKQLFFDSLTQLEQKLEYWRRQSRAERLAWAQKLLPHDLPAKQKKKYEIITQILKTD